MIIIVASSGILGVHENGDEDNREMGLRKVKVQRMGRGR